MSILQNELSSTLALHGEWQFALSAEPWELIRVPGCWEAQGHSKWGAGPARYRRTVLIPHDWGEQNLQDDEGLTIGRRAERAELWDGRARVVIATEWDELFLTYLRLGGRALLLPTVPSSWGLGGG